MSLNRQAIAYRRGIAPQGEDTKETFDTPDYSRQEYGKRGAGVSIPLLGAFTNWDLLPVDATIVATSDKLGLQIGTATLVAPARSDTGGVLLSTQVTNPADGDYVAYAGTAAGGLAQKISATANYILQMVLNISSTKFTKLFGSFGFNENVTDVDPTGTAGEGVMFLYDPTGEVTTGITVKTTWILAFKVNGVDTFADSGVTVVAGQDYDLQIVSQSDLTCKCYIDGVYVGVSPALTSGDTMRTFLGVELTETSAGQASFTSRFIRKSLQIG